MIACFAWVSMPIEDGVGGAAGAAGVALPFAARLDVGATARPSAKTAIASPTKCGAMPSLISASALRRPYQSATMRAPG